MPDDECTAWSCFPLHRVRVGLALRVVSLLPLPLVAGILTFNIFGISILFGVSSGLNTLLTQAEGRGDETVVMRRLYVNRTVVVMFLTAIPLGVLNWFSGSILSLAGQPVRACVYCLAVARIHVMPAVHWGFQPGASLSAARASECRSR